MKRLLLLLLAALPVSLFAQDKVINDPDAEARTIGTFHAIYVSMGIELIMKQGPVEALAVSAADKEVRDHIKTEVENGVLRIYFDYKWFSGSVFKNKHLKAYVAFKNIDKFTGASGALTTVDGSLTAGGDLEITLISGARFTGDVKAGNLMVKQVSGSKSYISGLAHSLTVQANSGAAFYGYGIAAHTCNAGATSGGKIEINVANELTALANSGGKIDYRGDGVIKKISTGSGGKVRRG